MSMYRCAACGSPNVMIDSQAGGVSFNFTKGAIGDAVMGPGGALAGLESSQTTVFKCPDCGMVLTYPMADSIKKAIDLGVMDLQSRNYLFVDGYSFDWAFLKSQFKNIESGPADYEVQKREEYRAKSLSSVATASKEEFDAAIDHVRTFKSKLGHYDYSGRQHLSTTKKRFSDTKPPELTEYLDLVSSTKTIIENMSNYVSPSSLRYPSEYRSLDSWDFTGLFISYILNEIRYNGYEKYSFENDSYRYHGIYKREVYNSCYIELLERNPFIIEFLRRYKDLLSFPFPGGSPDHFLNLLDELTPRQIPSLINEYFENLIIFNNDCTIIDYWKMSISDDDLFPGSKSAAVVVPAYKVENGKLGIWDYPVGNSTYMSKCRKFLSAHPEERQSFEKDIELRKQDLEDQEKYKTLDEAISRKKNALKSTEDKISANEARIKTLSHKIFGKAKAQSEAEQLKKENEKLLTEKAGQEEEFKALDAFKSSYRGPEHDLYYANRLFQKHDYLIEWEWIKPKASPVKASPAIKEPELKTEKTDEEIFSQTKELSSASEIREFKQLLDDGIITQEEFDAKKKQLLGL